jgi:hypothetical protein
MEAWRPLLEDCRFEGSLSEWTVLTGVLQCCAPLGARKVAGILQLHGRLSGSRTAKHPYSQCRKTWLALVSNPILIAARLAIALRVYGVSGVES